jgi:hypothetical protein
MLIIVALTLFLNKGMFRTATERTTAHKTTVARTFHLLWATLRAINPKFIRTMLTSS